jgi:hypothetical protein
VVTFPTVCAHILGTLMKFMGPDRIVFGSDAVWYGSPQWQIEALWRFQIPEDLRKQYKYPELKENHKRKILGLNSAKLYGLKARGELTPRGDKPKKGQYHPVPADYESMIPDDLKRLMEFPGFVADDNLSRMRREYLAMGGQRSNRRYGWIRV